MMVKAALALLFISVGLFAQETFWMRPQGPVGGTVRCLVALSEDTILAGTQYGGVFGSADGGLSWRHCGLAGNSIISLAMTRTGNVLAAVLGKGVYRSRDRGQSWQATALPEQTIYILAANSDGVIFAGTGPTMISGSMSMASAAGHLLGYQGVYRSTDDGDTWSAVGLRFMSVYGLSIERNNSVLAGTWQHGLYRSDDNGDNWVSVAFPDSTIDALCVDKDTSIFMATRSGNVYRSTDHGTTWTSVTGFTPPISFLTADVRGTVFAGTNDGVFESKDGGSAWIRFGLKNKTVNSIVEGSIDCVLAGTLGEGVYRTKDDGRTWQQTNAGLTSTFVTSFCPDRMGNVFAGTWESGLAKTTDRGASWALADMPEVRVNHLAISTTGSVFAGTSSGIYRSLDGETWQRSLQTASQVTAVAIDSSGSVLALANSLYRSIDNGESWSVEFPSATGFAMTVNRQGQIFIGGVKGVFRSLNGSASWTLVYPYVENVGAITIAPNGTIFAAGADGILFRSSDNGDTWQEYPSLPFGVISSIYVTSVGELYLGSESGVHHSTDDGTSWIDLNQGLSNVDVRVLMANPDGYLFVGTAGNGASRSAKKIVTSVDRTSDAIPIDLSLRQNFPNPFNPTTYIRFDLPTAGRVSLKVFDVLGQEVAVLLDGYQGVGIHEVHFDASHLPSGTYLYRLDSAGRSIVQKMLLVR